MKSIQIIADIFSFPGYSFAHEVSFQFFFAISFLIVPNRRNIFQVDFFFDDINPVVIYDFSLLPAFVTQQVYKEAMHIEMLELEKRERVLNCVTVHDVYLEKDMITRATPVYRRIM